MKHNISGILARKTNRLGNYVAMSFRLSDLQDIKPNANGYIRINAYPSKYKSGEYYFKGYDFDPEYAKNNEDDDGRPRTNIDSQEEDIDPSELPF